MRSLPPFRTFRRHLALFGLSVALTQMPALALMLAGARPTPAGWVVYGIVSVGAASGIYALALAWWMRIQRIVALVCGYAEHRQLPDAGATREGASFAWVQASLASLDRVVRGLEADAARDPLTGIANRRACMQRLETDLARARRGTAFSIVLFDLDELKTINDRYGHPIGDRALCRLAQVLQDTVREGDWSARWGGDEFLLGLWDAPREAAIATAGRVLARLAAEPVPLGDASVTLNSSAGVAQAQGDDDANRLFSRADDALLEAKRLGRGRVEVG